MFKYLGNIYRLYIRRAILTVLAVLWLVHPARAAAAMTADTTVSFAIFMPGPDIYELEGHAALRLSMPQGDFAVSFGTYDFEQPNFVYHFVKGETDYWTTVMPWDIFISPYLRQGRAIYNLQLDLTPAQVRAVVDTTEIYLLPENRTYRYNYVKDNCATRPLSILEKALGPRLKLGKVGSVGDEDLKTFRTVMRHYHSNYPWYQFGIDLALGSGIDYEISAHEQNFAPVLLLEQLQGATIDGHPLVKQSRQLNPGAVDATLDGTPWLLSPMAVALLVLLATIVLTIRDVRRRRVTRWFDAALFGIFGLAGCLLTFLIFVSVHEATSPNYLYLWLNPLCLIPAIFIWIKKLKKVVLCYQIANFVVVFAMAISWPWLPQSLNTAFIPLILSDLIRSASYIYLTHSRFGKQQNK